MNALATAAHYFEISEKYNRTVFELLKDGGVPEMPPVEIEQLAAVMAGGEITEIVQCLTRSSDQYNGQAMDAKRNPQDHNFSESDYLNMCRDMAHRAALWAVQ